MFDLELLKAEALAHPLGRSRIILVPGFDMVICLHNSSIVGKHRHPKYEAYHVMEGTLAVLFDDGLHVQTSDDPIVKIPPMTWHMPHAYTEFVIYREFYCGPFEKARDVEYAE